MSRQPRNVLYLGTYERAYPRNALVVAALRRAGFAVRELQTPAWERTRDKVDAIRSPGVWLRLTLGLARAYVGLAVRAPAAIRGADAVVVGYPGQLDMLLLTPLVHLLRRPVIFNPLVTLTDTLVDDRALIRPGTLPARAVAALDRAALALANVILVDTPENGRFLVERLRVPAAKIEHLGVGADDRMFTSVGHGMSRAAGEPQRVLFYGKYVPLHGVDTIVHAAALLDPTESAFTLIGSGQTKRDTLALARELAVTNVEFVDWAPYETLPQRIAAADVVLGIFGETAKAARVVPNKVYQAMAMGAAIVTADAPAVRHVLQHERSAWLVPPGDPQALAGAIRLLADPELREELGRNARIAFDEVGSIDALARRLGEIVTRVAASGRLAEPAWSRR